MSAPDFSLITVSPDRILFREQIIMAFEQAPLPFAPDALESYGMKAETFEFHYGKHHKAYVDNLNKLIDGKAVRHRCCPPRTESSVRFDWLHSAPAALLSGASGQAATLPAGS